MTLVDTSVWIDFFAGRDTPHVRRVVELLVAEDDLCLCGVVLTEILQGIRDDREYTQTKAMLANLLWLPMECHIFLQAAHIYRTLRKRGMTIRNSVDCMIAAVCLEYELDLLHHDRDFDVIAEHFDLRVVDMNANFMRT